MLYDIFRKQLKKLQIIEKIYKKFAIVLEVTQKLPVKNAAEEKNRQGKILQH